MGRKLTRKPSLRRAKKQQTPRKTNCWEFMECGRELNGKNSLKLGVCPAAVDPHADGINGGVNGGRICWAIVGIYSCHAGKSSLRGTGHSCFSCEFQKIVLAEEGIPTMTLPRKSKS